MVGRRPLNGSSARVPDRSDNFVLFLQLILPPHCGTRSRATLELKCAGLDAADLAGRGVEPSTMSLLGLVRHLADVERGWFRRRLAGQNAPRSLDLIAALPDGLAAPG
ncbi:MAG: DUF664 domain-containing protein [Micromonosporaceae bacterium]|nr:DUF664 domain-containing protein [Micromonosporaceae bacterium]